MTASTFEDYLKKPYAMEFQKMQNLHKDLLNEIGNDPEAKELYKELMDAARKYASIRAGWFQMSKEEKMEIDPLRTSHHNSLIIHFNVLSRYLRMVGKQAMWREQLGNEEENPYVRKTIGDFGCYLVFVDSICAR